MDKIYTLYFSPSLDPRVNLSLEEYLLEYRRPGEKILFLWQNQNTVVIGRNQNPYKECDIKRIKKDNVHLIRRLSGGGAVYHDLGNLNFTFIAEEEDVDISKNMEVILNALKTFGITGYFNGRNDLLVEGQKFSGNAFVSHNDSHLHHGTILVDVDLNKLSAYLTVSPLKLSSKGIDSVVSRVINLRSLNPDLTIENLKTEIFRSFNNLYGGNQEVICIHKGGVNLGPYIEKYKSWDWNYGESPSFSIEMEEKFDWGLFQLHLDLIDGKIQRCKIFTDALEPEIFKELEKNLLNKKFRKEDIVETVLKTLEDKEISISLKDFLEKQID